MGAFDDLIPESAPSAPGAFDDLIPKATAPEVGAVEGGVRAAGRGVPVVGSILDEIRAAVRAGDTTLNKAIAPYIPEAVKEATPDFIKKKLSDVPGETFGERYDTAVAEERAKDKAYDAANPVLSPALQIAGGVASGGALLKAAPAVGRAVLGMGGRTLAGKTAASVGAGATVGAVHGFGSGEGGIESRIAEAEKGAVLGGVLGTAAPAVGSVVGKAVNAFTKKAAPALDVIRKQAGRLYDKADQLGLVVSKSSLQAAGQDIQSALAQEGFHPNIHPKVAAAAEEIGKVADADQPLRMIQNLRRIAQAAGGSVEPDERRLGGILVEKLDNYLENLKPGDVLSGDPQEAAAVLKQARGLWSRVRKAQVIEDLLQRAEVSAPNFSGSGAENAVRREFIALAKNPKKMRGFNKEEQAAIKRVAQGGPLGNSLRKLGKLAPSSSVSAYLSGGMGAYFGGLIGGPIGGFAGAVAVPAVGGLARAGATAVTMGNARAASELIRQGGPTASPIVRTLADYARGSLQGANPALGQQVPDVPANARLNYLSMP